MIVEVGNEAMIENNDAANDSIKVLPEVATLNV